MTGLFIKFGTTNDGEVTCLITIQNLKIMKTTIKTFKVWASETHFLFSQNIDTKQANEEQKKVQKWINENLKDYKKLSSSDTLRGKAAKEKVILKAWQWNGSWANPSRRVIAVFYK